MEQNYLDMLMNDHAIIEKCLVLLEKQAEKGNLMSKKIVKLLMEVLYDYGELCHNQKEEQIYFPLLLERGLPPQGPIGVMLQEHQMERDYIKKINDSLDLMETKNFYDPSLKEIIIKYAELTKNHIWKENDILYPMGRRIINSQDEDYLAQEFLKIEAQSTGPNGYNRYLVMANSLEKQSGDKIDLLASLSTDVITHIIDALPIELSYVDADDRVRYYSKVEEKKIFPRTLSVIGRTVQQCHPPKSVHLVNKIISEMKAGERDKATFWIHVENMLIHISYYAVRDGAGNYEGCVEMVHDIQPYRELEGDKRLLDDE